MLILFASHVKIYVQGDDGVIMTNNYELIFSVQCFEHNMNIDIRQQIEIKFK